MNTPTTNFDIPKEVLDAARLLHLFFAEKGVTRWELMGVCSRNHAFDLHDFKASIKKIVE